MPVVVPIRILQGLLYVVGTYFLCASSVLFIRKIVSVPPEVSRKLLHLSAIIVLTVWLYVFADWRITEVTIVVFAVAAHPILLLLLSIKDRSIKDRPTASSSSPGGQGTRPPRWSGNGTGRIRSEKSGKNPWRARSPCLYSPG